MDRKTITKKEVIDKVSRRYGIHPDEVRVIIQMFLDSITEELSKGNRFEFRGFGVFEVIERKAKIGRNPNKPEEGIPIPARNVAKFTPGKKLKALVEANKA